MKVITLARKPISDTVVHNVLTHGCGGLNINASRIRDGSETNEAPPEYIPNYENEVFGSGMGGGAWANTGGRWPANLIFQPLRVGDGCPVKDLDEQSGVSKSTGGRIANISTSSTIYDRGKGLGQDLSADSVRGDPGYGDTGGASRFYKVFGTSKHK